jgi:hypothetical protein
MTPLMVVVVYFSNEQDIFGFKRNAKNFMICIFLIICALKLYTYLVFILRRSRWYTWVWRRLSTPSEDHKGRAVLDFEKV